jgi:uncharacterized membrane protein
MVPLLILAVFGGAIWFFVSRSHKRRLTIDALILEQKKLRSHYEGLRRDIQALKADRQSVPSSRASEIVDLKTLVPPEPLEEEHFPRVPEPIAVQDVPAPTVAIPHVDWENMLGTRGAVWVGGVALALGALFLVRYSWESGLLGPGVRLILGTLFACALIIISEHLRRSDRQLSLGGLNPTHIPSVLAGVGVLAGFAVIYSAHAVHGFLGETLAFLLMALLGLGALMASVLHGRLFGIFGLLGSYLTPMLVSSTAPNFTTLTVYVSLVTLTAFGLHTRQPDRWVTGFAILGHTFWAVLSAPRSPDSAAAFMLSLGIGAWLILKEAPAWRLRRGVMRQRLPLGWNGQDALTLVALSIALILIGMIWMHHGAASTLRHAAVLLLVFGGLMTAIRFKDTVVIAPLSGALLVGCALVWPTPKMAFGLSPTQLFELFSLNLINEAAPLLLATALIGVALAVGLPLLALARARTTHLPFALRNGCLAFTAAITPVALLLAVCLRFNGFDRNLLGSLLAAGLTVALYGVSNVFFKRETHPEFAPLKWRHLLSSAFAAGAALALGLAITLALRDVWLVTGLAVASAVVAYVAHQRPLLLMRSISATLATAAVTRAVLHPSLAEVGSLPLFNTLLFSYGVPALGFAMAAFCMRGISDKPLRVVKAVAFGFGTAFFVLTIRHSFHGSNLGLPLPFLFGYTPWITFAEAGFYSALPMSMVFLALWRRAQRRYVPQSVLSVPFAVLCAVAYAVFVGGFGNPFLTDQPLVGVWLLDNSVIGILMPALLCVAAVWQGAKHGLPRAAQRVYGALALIGVGAWLLLEVRHGFVGAGVAYDSFNPPAFEIYSYSATILLYGVALLWLGFQKNSRDLRLAAMTVLTVAVCKVFVLDMAHLKGVLRALSFMGLGGSLMGIGLFYQRLQAREDG